MEQFTSQIYKIIERIGVSNLVIIGVILLALIIALLIYRSIRLKVRRQEIVEIENEVNGIKTLPIQYRLGRVQSIAKNMKEVANDYEEFAKEYERINEFQQNKLSVLVNEVDEQLFYGKLRGVSKKMKSLQEMTYQYGRDSKALLKKIEKVTEIENVQRIEIIRVKEKYRKVTEHYDEIKLKVDSFVPTIGDIFKNIDEDFVKLEGMMNNQLFDDAKSFTTQIEGRIDQVDESMKNLPSYVKICKQLLPIQIEKVSRLIDDLEEDIYALDKLKANSRYNDIVDLLKEITALVKAVDVENVGDKIKTISNDIESLANDLLKEKESFKNFKDNWNNVTTLIEETREKYNVVIEEYNDLKSKYILNEDKVTIKSNYDAFESYENDYLDMKSKLETGSFSYSDMLDNVSQIIENVSKHDEYINDFNTHKERLYYLEEKANEEIENINIVLLETKSEIKNHHLPMINESYEQYIKDSYDKVNQIKEFKNKKPVLLEELSKKVKGAKDVIYKLYDNVHNLVVTAQMVEEAIVFGNRYRSTYLEVNTELTKAEVLYRNGEYTKALTVAVDIIEKIKPGSYEEMIKKAEVKSAS